MMAVPSDTKVSRSSISDSVSSPVTFPVMDSRCALTSSARPLKYPRRVFRGDRVLPFCEVEAEKKSGSEEACRAFAEALAQRFDLREEPRSKFVRAVTL